MAAHNVDVLIGARNNASATINKVKADIGGLDAQASKLGGAFQAAFVGGLGGVVGAAGLGAITQIGSAIEEMVAKAGQVNKLRGSFDDLATGVGQSADKMLATLRRASYGMISDADLMLSANKAMLLGVADSADEMAALLDVARSRGAAMGLSVGQAFNDIVTGLGRESALILDNLGITIDLESVMADYAKTLGTTADALDGVQRKQALVNEVMRQSAGMTTEPPSGAGAAAARAAVAQENAQVAMGGFWAPFVAEGKQAEADIYNVMGGVFDAIGRQAEDATLKAAELQDAYKTNPAVAVDMQGWNSLAQAYQQYSDAVAAGMPRNQEMENSLLNLSRNLNMTGGSFKDLKGSLDGTQSGLSLTIKLFREVESTSTAFLSAAQYAKDYDNMLIVMAGNSTQLAAQTAAVQATLEGMAAKLGMVGQMALGAASDVASFNLEVARIQGAIAVTEGIRNSAISKAQSLAMQALDQGADPDAVRQMLVDTTGALEDLTLQYDASSGAQFDNQLKTRGVTESLEDYTERLREANAASKKLASEGLKDLNKEYDDLKSKVSGVLSGALQTDVKVEGQDGAAKDAINENAKRLAAIANEGLINQPWLEEFANEVPGIFADLKLTEAAGGSVRDAAARMFADFQDGLQPELIDRDMAKERVKRMILGEQSMAALSAEIAAELAQEMGISLGEAQAAASSALGVKPTAGAMEKAGDGAAESGQAQKFVSAWVLEMNTQYTRIYATGVTSGEQWGTGFLTSVQNGVPSELIMLLVTLITPEVLAKIRALQGQSGAIP